MNQVNIDRWQDNPADYVNSVALPLKNLEFLINDYLMANGTRLDVETRLLLAGVRDSLDRVANSPILAAEPVA